MSKVFLGERFRKSTTKMFHITSVFEPELLNDLPISMISFVRYTKEPGMTLGLPHSRSQMYFEKLYRRKRSLGRLASCKQFAAGHTPLKLENFVIDLRLSRKRTIQWSTKTSAACSSLLLKKVQLMPWLRLLLAELVFVDHFTDR